MDAWQMELSLRVSETPGGVSIEIWQCGDLVAMHWGQDLEAATICASVSVASYVADGLAQTS